jgi:DnaK suppressor protein
MKNELLAQIKEKLLTMKSELLIKANKLPDIDTDGDETDEVQGNLLIEIANQLSSRDISKISLVNNALRKIEDSSYGLCEDCEEEILEKRLLANPCFKTCVLCAEAREAEEKQRKRF